MAEQSSHRRSSRTGDPDLDDRLEGLLDSAGVRVNRD